VKKYTFEDFVNETSPYIRNAHVTEPGIVIYVRKPTGFTHNADFELATLSARKPGSGALTKFMDKYADKYTFYVENILETRLINFFEKYNLRLIETTPGLPDRCMISAQCHHFRDDIAKQVEPSAGFTP
jgi:hypothetical protein